MARPRPQLFRRRAQVHAFRTRFARELEGRLVVFPAPSPGCTAPTSAPGLAAPPGPEPAGPPAAAAAQEQPAGVCAAAWALDARAALPYVHMQIVESQVRKRGRWIAAGAPAHAVRRTRTSCARMRVRACRWDCAAVRAAIGIGRS